LESISVSQWIVATTASGNVTTLVTLQRNGECRGFIFTACMLAVGCSP
jgi:hypothetical protein